MSTNKFISLRTNILIWVASFRVSAKHIIIIIIIIIIVIGIIIIIIIIIIRHELGSDRPVSASSNILFQALRSNLRSFVLKFSQISFKLKYWDIICLALYPNTAKCLENVYPDMPLDAAVLCNLIRTLVCILNIVYSESLFPQGRTVRVSNLQKHNLYRWRKTPLSTKDPTIKRSISWRQSDLYNLHQKTKSAVCNDALFFCLHAFKPGEFHGCNFSFIRNQRLCLWFYRYNNSLGIDKRPKTG